MTRYSHPGRWYCDSLPSGEWAAFVAAGAAHIDSHVGEIGLPGEGVLYLRITNVGGFGMCGQGWDTGKAWQWRAGQWTEQGLAHGTSGCIFDNAGNLLVIRPGANVTSQGYRFVAADGIAWLGDETYTRLLPDGQLIHEYTELAGVIIGQGHDGGCHVFIDGKRRLLEAGATTFVRVREAGGLFSISMVKPGEAVMVWATREELAALPLADASVPPPVDPPKPPDPPKEPPVDDVDQTPTALDRLVLDELVTQRPNYPDPMPAEQSARNNALGEYLNHAVGVLQSRGLAVWLEKKSGNPDNDNCARLPGTSQGIANDIVQTEEGGKRYGRDFLSATDPGEPARPSMGFKGYASRDMGIDPVPSGVVVPPKPPDNPPPTGTLEARVAALEARFVLQDAIDATIRSDVGMLASKVHDLEAQRPPTDEAIARAMQGVARRGDNVTITGKLPLVGPVTVHGKIDS